MTPIEQIKAAIRVDEYAARYLTVRNGKALCPFHKEKTPSLSVHEAFYKCHACGVGGDVIKFAAAFHDISTGDAIRMFAAELGIPLTRQPEKHPYDAAKDARMRAEAEEWKRQMRRSIILAMHYDHFDRIEPFLDMVNALGGQRLLAAYKEQRTMEQGIRIRESIREKDQWEKAMKPLISGFIDRLAGAPDSEFPEWQYGEREW